MFHICFVANENYIKYTAVLITSIIKSTDTSKKFKDFFEINPHAQNAEASLASYKKRDYSSLSKDEQSEGFIFHILSDFVSENSRAKIANLAKALSEIYSCEIQIHICDDDIFQGLPKWCGNYAAYHRLLISNFMPENLKLCLYLDVDMLVFKDLRELWTLNLEHKVVGVITHSSSVSGVYAINPQNENFYFTDFYFCSGLLLINLSEWGKHNISKKALNFISQYEVICPDQDALCAVIADDLKLALPYEYGIYLSYDPNGYFWNRRQYIPKFTYTKEQMDFAYLNAIIWHYLGSGFKPWEKVDVGTDKKGKNFAFYWWQVAFQTPFFKDELKRLFTTKKENYLICKEFGLYIASLINEHSKSFLGYLKMPFVVWRAFKEFDLTKNDDYVAKVDTNLDKNLAFEFLYIATKAWGRRKQSERIFQFFALPYKIYRAKCRCRKGNFRAQRESVYHKLYIT